MADARVSELYERHIKPLPEAERRELLALVARDLATESLASGGQPQRSIMELHGLGREIWEGVDAQAYIDELSGGYNRQS